MSAHELNPWIEAYMEYLRDVKRMKKGTLVDMRCTFNGISRAMEQIRPGTPLWKISFEDYLVWVNRKRDEGLSAKSINKQISHARGLLNYAWHSGRTDRNVLDGFSLKDAEYRKPPRCLGIEEAERLVWACRSRSKRDRRDRTIVLLLYGCGLRTAELCNLNVSDVDLERKEIFVRKGKGEIQRRIPVPDGVWTELLAYLAERGGKRGALLKTHEKSRRISHRIVNDVIKETASRANIDGKVTAKTLRHTFATHLMDGGVDLGVIATLMGHRSPNETGVYLHVLGGKQENAIGKLVQPDSEEKEEKG